MKWIGGPGCDSCKLKVSRAKILKFSKKNLRKKIFSRALEFIPRDRVVAGRLSKACFRQLYNKLLAIYNTCSCGPILAAAVRHVSKSISKVDISSFKEKSEQSDSYVDGLPSFPNPTFSLESGELKADTKTQISYADAAKRKGKAVKPIQFVKAATSDQDRSQWESLNVEEDDVKIHFSDKIVKMFSASILDTVTSSVEKQIGGLIVRMEQLDSMRFATTFNSAYNSYLDVREFRDGHRVWDASIMKPQTFVNVVSALDLSKVALEEYPLIFHPSVGPLIKGCFTDWRLETNTLLKVEVPSTRYEDALKVFVRKLIPLHKKLKSLRFSSYLLVDNIEFMMSMLIDGKYFIDHVFDEYESLFNEKPYVDEEVTVLIRCCLCPKVFRVFPSDIPVERIASSENFCSVHRNQAPLVSKGIYEFFGNPHGRDLGEINGPVIGLTRSQPLIMNVALPDSAQVFRNIFGDETVVEESDFVNKPVYGIGKLLNDIKLGNIQKTFKSLELDAGKLPVGDILEADPEDCCGAGYYENVITGYDSCGNAQMDQVFVDIDCGNHTLASGQVPSEVYNSLLRQYSSLSSRYINLRLDDSRIVRMRTVRRKKVVLRK